MRSGCALLALATLLLAGCGKGNDTLISAKAAALRKSATPVTERSTRIQPKPVAKAKPSVPVFSSPDRLIMEVEKLDGYTNIDFADPKRPIVFIQFRNPGPSDTDLEQLRVHLAEAPIAVALDLSGWSGVTHTGVAHLKGITTLHSLNLEEVPLTDAGLEHLSGLTGLRKLNLNDTKITGLGLKHLHGLTNLQILALDNNKITD